MIESVKIQYLLVSLIFLLTAYGVFFQGHIVLGAYGMDLNTLEKKLSIAIPSLITGIYFFYKFFITKYKKIKKEYSICPKCEESYNYSDLKDGMCPKCNIKTENLEGFYEKREKKLIDSLEDY